MKYKPGMKIWFKGEIQGYTIQACDKRFLICTKPFNLRKTVLYTLVDLQEKIRGIENPLFGLFKDIETKEQCEDVLERLQNHQSEISMRNRVVLKITKIDKKNKERI